MSNSIPTYDVRSFIKTNKNLQAECEKNNAQNPNKGCVNLQKASAAPAVTIYSTIIDSHQKLNDNSWFSFFNSAVQAIPNPELVTVRDAHSEFSCKTLRMSLAEPALMSCEGKYKDATREARYKLQEKNDSYCTESTIHPNDNVLTEERTFKCTTLPELGLKNFVDPTIQAAAWDAQKISGMITIATVVVTLATLTLFHKSIMSCFSSMLPTVADQRQGSNNQPKTGDSANSQVKDSSKNHQNPEIVETGDKGIKRKYINEWPDTEQRTISQKNQWLEDQNKLLEKQKIEYLTDRGASLWRNAQGPRRMSTPELPTLKKFPQVNVDGLELPMDLNVPEATTTATTTGTTSSSPNNIPSSNPLPGAGDNAV
jgi:hypothetical protein